MLSPWVARFPGTLGNTLKVEMADKFSSTNTSIASIALDSTDSAGDRSSATVAISAPDLATSAGGVQATATATIDGGNVTAIVVTHPGFWLHWNTYRNYHSKRNRRLLLLLQQRAPSGHMRMTLIPRQH